MSRFLTLCLGLLAVQLTACSYIFSDSPDYYTASTPLVDAARRQIGVTTKYDPAYVKLEYPGGDVDSTTGVCTDVVIRAFRRLGVDLQKEVHLDMSAHFEKYPQKWGLKGPDPNIDHRRVPNLMKWMERKGFKQKVTRVAANYQTGDIVCWQISDKMTHIGIVSNGRTEEDVPLIIHNAGWGTVESDFLFGFKIIGHYRPKFPARPAADSQG